MKKIYYLLLTMTVLIVCASCNNEWESEQYVQMVSFKAPVNAQGVTPIYIRYKPEGKVTYQLPLIVSGSTMNSKDLNVHVGLDLDTLDVLNISVAVKNFSLNRWKTSITSSRKQYRYRQANVQACCLSILP